MECVMDLDRKESEKLLNSYILITQKRVAINKLQYWENQLRLANKYIKKYKSKINQLKKEIEK